MDKVINGVSKKIKVPYYRFCSLFKLSLNFVVIIFVFLYFLQNSKQNMNDCFEFESLIYDNQANKNLTKYITTHTWVKSNNFSIAKNDKIPASMESPILSC